MPPFATLAKRAFEPDAAASSLSDQWRNPSDVFSVLLILGGDVIARALAQLAGSRFTPVAFSFGTCPSFLPVLPPLFLRPRNVRSVVTDEAVCRN